MRLNLGCGFDHRDGYLNIDFLARHEPDLLGDVMQLPLRDGGAREVLAQDVLEHLPRTSTDAALTEWARVLGDGGEINLRLPSLLHTAARIQESNEVKVHELMLQNLYGTQAYTGDVHLTSFTNLSLATALHRAGFRRVQGEVVDDWMFDVVAHREDGPPLAVFMEEGFYGLEGEDSWRFRWCGPAAHLRVVNSSDAPLNAVFRARTAADHDPRPGVRIQAGDQTASFKFGQPIEFTFAARPGVTSLRLSTTNRRVKADDPRVLHFQCISPSVEVVGS